MGIKIVWLLDLAFCAEVQVEVFDFFAGPWCAAKKGQARGHARVEVK